MDEIREHNPIGQRSPVAEVRAVHPGKAAGSSREGDPCQARAGDPIACSSQHRRATQCDHAGADAVVRAFRRAVISGTELRLVVTAPTVSRMLSLSGLDRLVPVYPCLEAAAAAGG